MERWDRGREGQVIQEQGRGIHLHTNCFSFSLSQKGEKDHLSPSETPVSFPLFPPLPSPPSLLCESSVNGEPHSVQMNGMGWIWVGGNSDQHSPPMPEPHVQHITIWSLVTAEGCFTLPSWTHSQMHFGSLGQVWWCFISDCETTEL